MENIVPDRRQSSSRLAETDDFYVEWGVTEYQETPGGVVSRVRPVSSKREAEIIVSGYPSDAWVVEIFSRKVTPWEPYREERLTLEEMK